MIDGIAKANEAFWSLTSFCAQIHLNLDAGIVGCMILYTSKVDMCVNDGDDDGNIMTSTLRSLQ
jgi:hypothetical protein